MPYICLANANVPGGVLQITDLWPNESQRIPGIDPPGQNRYLRRPATDLVGLSATGEVVGLTVDANKYVLEGLGAYILDCIEPGGTETAAGTVTSSGVLVGDTLTFTAPGGDVVFTAVENAPTGTITVVAPVAGVAQLTLGGVPFDCVEDFATGTIQAVGPLVNDTVLITGETFTAVENAPTGTITVVAPVAGVAQLTLGGVPFDCVEDVATGTITPNTVLVGHTVTIAGVAFVAAAVADIPNQVFDQSGTDQQCSDSLVLAINHANAQVLIIAALDALMAGTGGGGITASNAGGTAVPVTLTSVSPGLWGDAPLVNTVGATLAVSGATMTHTDPVAANQEFGSLAHYTGWADDVAGVTASLTAAINDAATVALMDAANAGPVPTADFGHIVAADLTPDVGLTASQVGNSGTLSLATAQVVNLAISGAALGGHAADPTAQEFDSLINAGTNILVAGSLATAINDAASQALLTAALDALVAVPTAGTLTGANGGTDTVTLTPSVAGAWGDATLTDTGGVRIVTSGVAMTHTDPNPAVQEFGSLAHYEGSADAAGDVVASLVAAINDAATVALMDAANAGPVPTADFGHMVAVDSNPDVGLTASQVGNSGTLSLATAQVVNLAISGAALGGHLADASVFEFDSLINAVAGTNPGVATSIAAVLNHANTDAALAAVGGSSVTAVPAGAVVTATADTAGAAGSMLVTGVNAARVVVSAGALAKTMVAWTGALIADSVTALQNLVDTGAACTVTAINNVLNALGGVSGISVATTGSSTLAEILSVLAGRVYRVPVGEVKDPTGQTWDVTRLGSFTTPNVVFDTEMNFGEWRPTTGWIKHGKERQAIVSGGDTENNEIGGVRTTVDTAHFQQSLQTGQLSHYAAGIDLFPDPEVQAFVSNWTRRTNRQAPLLNQRVVTVYDDDGTLLA